ncbi:hypothetical protein NM208_g7639 [Fusarium decemcellulare]|uniref:Uncharacterized protein n=1 Tax=Fusarium decemcellulare TaxID=57161 RepID=A0ACC1S8C5_9HYPO|nr:hypothetical protein NM208_g7639 [Fusarium decemcellulare]
MSIFRDAVIGSVIRAAGGRKLLRYPEEEAEFKLPDEWRLDSRADNQSPSASPSSSANPNDDLQQQEHSQSKHITTVSWYAEDDPDNPYNWSRRKTTWVSTLLFAYTFAAYVGASIYALRYMCLPTVPRR